MKFYMFYTLGNGDDRTLAFFEDPPVGLELRDYYIRQGKRLGPHYPEGAHMHMDPRTKGLKLASMLGNTQSFLIVDSDVKRVIEAHAKAEIEYLQVGICNHKKRLQSSNYWIINVIGTLDCVNHEQSDITYEDESREEILGVTSIVLDKEKAQFAPGLFRVPEKPEEIFVNEDLHVRLQAGNFSNLMFEPVEAA